MYLYAKLVGTFKKEFLGENNPQTLQLLQTMVISSFLIVGTFWLKYVDIVWWQIVMVLTTTGVMDYFLCRLLKAKIRFPLSAINSGIGICLFLRTEWWPILFFTGIVAVTTKYVFHSGSKHFFNPSYTAMLLSLVLFSNKAFINHFQWGYDWQVLLPIFLLGTFIVIKAKLWDSVLAFWGTLLLCLNLFVDYSIEDFVWLFLTGSFLIISFHGFTDPVTMPKVRPYRLLFAAQIAILFFICRQFVNEGYSFFVAYFLVNLFEVGLWHLESKTWRGFDLRLLVQSGLTVSLFLILFGTSYAFYLDTNGTWPQLLTNRCVQLICQRDIKHAWEE